MKEQDGIVFNECIKVRTRMPLTYSSYFWDLFDVYLVYFHFVCERVRE